MQSSLSAGLWMLGAVLAVSACDGPTAATNSSSDLNATKAASEAGDIHLLGDFALYMPAAPDGPRAVIVALGGPRTRAIVTGESFGAPPTAEPALQVMGAAMRAFADEHGVAILGTSLFGPTALQDGVATDERILTALDEGAEASGRPALATAPILMFGLSGGGPAVSGFAARRPEHVAGLLLKAPSAVTTLQTDAQREVPTFLALAELDVLVDNSTLRQSFATNRGGGALWALAIEPGAVHFSYSDALRNATIEWMRSIVDRRVAGSSGRIQPAVAASGWLGDPATGEVSPWGRHRGDRSAASWFPTQRMAESWRVLIGAASGN
jgi:hypothetical protein